MKIVPAYIPPSGKSTIAIVGEAPGADEERLGSPFVGSAGYLLTSLLRTVGIDRKSCTITNVINVRPPSNDETYFFIKKAAAKKEGIHPNFPPYGDAGFLRPEYERHIERLRSEIKGCNIAIALGSLALWALTEKSAISKYRGYLMPSTLVHKLKVLPTYHPAAVMRQYSLQSLVLPDLHKVKQNDTPIPITRPARTAIISPTLNDLLQNESKCINTVLLCVDIENIIGTTTILCVALAPSSSLGISIPFMDETKPDGRYWSKEEFPQVIQFLARVLSTQVPKLGQNIAYDLTWLDHYGIKVRGIIHDTMFLHHAMQPEMLKSLNVLASLYSKEGPWKQDVSLKEGGKVGA